MSKKYHFHQEFPTNVRRALQKRLCSAQLTVYCHFVLKTISDAFYNGDTEWMVRSMGYEPRLQTVKEGHAYDLDKAILYHTVVLYLQQKVMLFKSPLGDGTPHPNYYEVAKRLERGFQLAQREDIPRQYDLYADGQDNRLYYCQGVLPTGLLAYDGSPGKQTDTVRLIKGEIDIVIQQIEQVEPNFDAPHFTQLDVKMTQWSTYCKENKLTRIPNILQ